MPTPDRSLQSLAAEDSPITTTTTIPHIGSGIGYRREISSQLLAKRDRVDVVELLVEQFISSDTRLAEAKNICATIPTVPHGVGLSIGSTAGPDLNYLSQIKKISDMCSARYYSEHLCMTRAPAIDIGHLAPLRFTEEALDRTIKNVHIVQEFLNLPLVLENVTYPFSVPGATLSEAEFFTELVNRTGCGILLDLTNVYINSINHDFSASDFIDSLPLSSVVQVHLAGGYWSDGIFIDGHSEPVHEAVWSMFADLCQRISIRTCILEQDTNFPADIEVLIRQVERARSIQEDAWAEAE